MRSTPFDELGLRVQEVELDLVGDWRDSCIAEKLLHTADVEVRDAYQSVQRLLTTARDLPRTNVSDFAFVAAMLI